MRDACCGVWIALLMLVSPGLAQAACTIADPTGTPLNVREEPNGRIVGTLPNGILVEPLEERRLGAKGWIRVAVGSTPRGWVFGAYVICDGNDIGDVGDSLKSAPMRPRQAPN